MQFQNNWQTKHPFTLLRWSLKQESWIILLVQFFHNSHLKHTGEGKQNICKRNCKNHYRRYYHFQIISLGISLCTFPGQTCKVCCNLGKGEIEGKKLKGKKNQGRLGSGEPHLTSACQTIFQLYSQNIQQHHPWCPAGSAAHPEMSLQEQCAGHQKAVPSHCYTEIGWIYPSKKPKR